MAELPLTVQSVSVVVPWPMVQARRRCRRAAELPLTVQSVSVIVAPIVVQAAAVVAGGVAADGAVGQRESCRRSCTAPPPLPLVEPPVMVSPEIDARYIASRPEHPAARRR